MIGYARRAIRQIEDLRQYYEDRERYDAIATLDAALELAERRIASNPLIGLAAPRPYPGMARPGRLWTKAGRYWVAYYPTQPPIIAAIFFETSDIPGRL